MESYIPLFMFVTLGVGLFSGLPVALVLTGVGFVFGLLGWGMALVRPGDFGIIYYRIFVTLTDYDDVLWAAVPLVIFMGVILEHSGIARELLLTLKLLLRRIPGGLAIAVTVIGIILAPSAGMVGASIATLALVALPAMLEQGYKPSFAAGSIAAAGTLGVGLPPGLMLFFLAGAMGIQIPFVFLAMLGPALLIFLFYVAYFGVTSWFGLALSPEGTSATHEGSPGSLLQLLSSLVLPLGVVGVMLGSVVVGWATFSEAAAFGAAGAVLMTLFRGRLTWGLLHRAIKQTVITTAMVFFIFVGASFFSMIFRIVGGVEAVTAFLDAAHLGSWGTLTLVLAVIFLMGCFMDWVEIVVISFTIFRPVLDRLDFSGYVDPPYLALGWITVLVALTLQSSFLTPPFGFALFFVKASAPPRVRMVDVYKGIVPFVVIQVIVIVCVAAFPRVAVWLPAHTLELGAPQTVKGLYGLGGRK